MCDRLVDLLDSVLCTFVYFVTSGSIDKAYRKRNGFPARTRDTSTPKVECFVVSLFSLSLLNSDRNLKREEMRK